MFRALMAMLLTLAASACTIGIPSAVEAAPFDARMTAPPFPEGVYCGVEEDEDGRVVVRTGGGESDSDCATVAWDGARRMVIVRDMAGEDEPVEFAPADLGDGLFLMQIREDGDDRPFSFLLLAGMAEGRSMVFLPLTFGDKETALASRFPSIAVGRYPAPSAHVAPAQTDEDRAGDPVSAPSQDAFYISGGSPAEIRSLVRDVAANAMREFMREARENGEPLLGNLPVIVRDSPAAADHILTAPQKRDAETLIARLQALTAPH